MVDGGSSGGSVPNQNGNRKQVAFVEETTTITAGTDLPLSGAAKNIRVRFSIEE